MASKKPHGAGHLGDSKHHDPSKVHPGAADKPKGHGHGSSSSSSSSSDSDSGGKHGSTPGKTKTPKMKKPKDGKKSEHKPH
ncbi:immortalization up-regulated protein [Erinaceus europaeus]|uniref:Immortalization up-regulated protein n=1 Tax=Erinaceus europaeus TaxID=9365 RepID=A0A1S3WQI8_ERIEU|nr:immortalization up-regulated protein [Erinaceus europaeus]